MNGFELFCGFSEGISTLGMSLAYLYIGGDATSFLFLIYLVHFFASFAFHICPNKWTRFFNISMINLMIMERGYLKTKNVWMYYCCLGSMLIDPPIPQEIMVMARAAIVCVQGQTSFVYLYLWAVAAFFYLGSCKFQKNEDRLWTMLTCVLYHIFLAATSALEVSMYAEEITNTSDGFLRYCAYLLFISVIMTRVTTEPKRLRSILSLITALVLSPMSLLVIYKEVLFGEGYEKIQYFMGHFYLAYIMIDLLVGMVYYPEYFTFLEGWLHHIGTSFIVYYGYYISPIKRKRVCVLLIVETSSIFLFLSRVLYDVPWIQKIKKKIFYPSFLLFRIVVPIYIVLYLNLLCDIYDYLIFSSFTLLNVYWLIKMWF